MNIIFTIIIILLNFITPTCWSMRDPFHIDDMMLNESVLKKIILTDLNYVGAIILKQDAIGFVEDPYGNFYGLRVGQKLGSNNEEITTILPDKIVLTNGLHFIVIKGR